MRRLRLALFGLIGLASDCDGQSHAMPSNAHESQLAGMRFLELVTGGAGAGDTLPLLVVLHGLGGRPEQVLAISQLSQLPVHARIVAPYGFAPYHSGFSWMTGANDDESFAANARGAAERLAPWVNEFAHTRPTVGKAVLVGFSQGASVTITLSVMHPELLRAAFTVSGTAGMSTVSKVWSSYPSRPPIHMFHGTADAVFPIGWARYTADRLSALGYPTALTEYPSAGHRLSEAAWSEIRAAIGGELQR